MRNIALSFVVIGMLLTGCSQEKSSQATSAAKPNALPVEAFSVTLAKTEFTKNYAALLKPYQEVQVVARINAILEKEYVHEGSYVTKGQTLYLLQQNEYKAALESAEALHLKAEANFEKSSKDWSRAEYLFSNKAISEEQHDALKYAFDDAKATLQGTKAALNIAQIEYDYTTIKAPISGRIGLSLSDVGTYITSQNATLTTITALDPIYAEFSIPNSDVSRYISQIKVGAKVSMQVGSKNYEGSVDYIAPKLDAQTDTLLVRATFTNRDKDLIVGSYTQVRLEGFSYDNVAIIPENTLLKTPDATLVYVIGEGGTLSMRPVTIAHVKDGNAVVLEGLQEGEKIVASNIAKLRPTSLVSIIGGK